MSQGKGPRFALCGGGVRVRAWYYSAIIHGFVAVPLPEAMVVEWTREIVGRNFAPSVKVALA